MAEAEQAGVRSHIVERRYRPGESAQESGVYNVLHLRHRPVHAVLILAGMQFPRCRTCGDQVRFQMSHPAHNWGLSGQIRTPAVLVADPERGITDALKRELEREGYEVSVAAGYADALQLLGRRGYDAIITELDLEHERVGLELARNAQSMRAAPLVILSTRNPTENSLRAVLGSRIHYLVTKPIDVGELRSVLARLIMRRAAVAGPFPEWEPRA